MVQIICLLSTVSSPSEIFGRYLSHPQNQDSCASISVMVYLACIFLVPDLLSTVSSPSEIFGRYVSHPLAYALCICIYVRLKVGGCIRIQICIYSPLSPHGSRYLGDMCLTLLCSSKALLPAIGVIPPFISSRQNLL